MPVTLQPIVRWVRSSGDDLVDHPVGLVQPAVRDVGEGQDAAQLDGVLGRTERLHHRQRPARVLDGQVPVARPGWPGRSPASRAAPASTGPSPSSREQQRTTATPRWRRPRSPAFSRTWVAHCRATTGERRVRVARTAGPGPRARAPRRRTPRAISAGQRRRCGCRRRRGRGRASSRSASSGGAPVKIVAVTTSGSEHAAAPRRRRRPARAAARRSGRGPVAAMACTPRWSPSIVQKPAERAGEGHHRRGRRASSMAARITSVRLPTSARISPMVATWSGPKSLAGQRASEVDGPRPQPLRAPRRSPSAAASCFRPYSRTVSRNR